MYNFIGFESERNQPDVIPMIRTGQFKTED